MIDGRAQPFQKMIELVTMFWRSVFQADAIFLRTLGKPGMPLRSSGGKYVPPTNGFRSGVSQTLIGQPPWPVVACTNVM
jgi:hypothetical protein